MPGANVARGSDRLVITGVESALPFSLAASSTTFSAKDLPALAVLDADPSSGWGVNIYGDPRIPVLCLRFAQPFADGPLTIHLQHDSSHRGATTRRFRLALSKEAIVWPVSFGMKKPTLPAEVTDREVAFYSGDVPSPKPLSNTIFSARPWLKSSSPKAASLK